MMRYKSCAFAKERDFKAVFSTVIEGDSGAKVNNLLGDSVGHCEECVYKFVSNSEWLPR
jgi:hypothetical protein